MATGLARDERRIGGLGWSMIGLRLLLMAALLIVCVPLHFLWKLLGLKRFWPRVFLSGIGMVVGLDIRQHGRQVPGALLLSNHVSWMDIFALSQTADSAFVAHDGLAQIGPLKWLCDMNDTVFIARHRRADVSAQAFAIREALAGGGTLTLFPEGTTSDGTGLRPFKSSLLGAVEPLPEGVAVQPVLLAYRDAPHVSWVDEEPGLDNFRRIAARLRPIELDVHFLAPLTGPDLADRKAMTAAGYAAIARAQENDRTL